MVDSACHSNMVTIQPLKAEHLPACATLESILFAEEAHWSYGVFQQILTDSAAHYYVALAGSKLIGYAGVYLSNVIGAEAEIHTIAVDHNHQGRKIGQQLLEQLLAHVDKFKAATFLEVRVDNTPALGLYRKYGFTILGIRPRYYQPIGKDAFTMKREAITTI